MRLLITGDRNWRNEDIIHAFLKSYLESHPGLVIIHGGADGADSIAGDIAESMGIKTLEFKADWNRYGRAAGPIRNQQMLDEGRPDAVVAFHRELRYARGTLDMVKRARQHNLPVTWLNDSANTVDGKALDAYLETC